MKTEPDPAPDDHKLEDPEQPEDELIKVSSIQDAKSLKGEFSLAQPIDLDQPADQLQKQIMVSQQADVSYLNYLEEIHKIKESNCKKKAVKNYLIYTDQSATFLNKLANNTSQMFETFSELDEKVVKPLNLAFGANYHCIRWSPG